MWLKVESFMDRVHGSLLSYDFLGLPSFVSKYLPALKDGWIWKREVFGNIRGQKEECRRWDSKDDRQKGRNLNLMCKVSQEYYGGGKARITLDSLTDWPICIEELISLWRNYW